MASKRGGDASLPSDSSNDRLAADRDGGNAERGDGSVVGADLYSLQSPDSDENPSIPADTSTEDRIENNAGSGTLASRGRPGVENIDEGDEPIHPASVSSAYDDSVARKAGASTNKQRVEQMHDAVGPLPPELVASAFDNSASKAKEEAQTNQDQAQSTIIDEPNELLPPVPFNPTVFVDDDDDAKNMGKGEPVGLNSAVDEEAPPAEDEEVSGITRTVWNIRNAPGSTEEQMESREYGGVAGTDIDSATLPLVHGRGDIAEEKANSDIGNHSSDIHIPEAWAVGGNSEHEQGGNENVFVATPVVPSLPWWKQTESRLYTWALLCIFSAIALTAYRTNPDLVRSRSAMEKRNSIFNSFGGEPPYPWDNTITGYTATALSLSAMFSVAHIFGTKNAISRCLVGTIIEGITALIISLLGGGCLMLISDPKQVLAVMWAVRPEGGTRQSINDGNLFFSSWGMVVCSLILFSMYMGEQKKKILRCFNVSGASNGMGMEYTIKWTLLFLASLVTIVESAWFNQLICEEKWTGDHFTPHINRLNKGSKENDDLICGRNVYGLITGSIGVIISVSMILLSYFGRDSAWVSTIIGLISVVNYVFCAGILCFGYGPATSTGNQFFAAWSGVFLSLSLFGGALKEYLNVRGAGDATSVANEAENESLV